MSSNSLTRALPNEVFFRNVNGEWLALEEKESLNLSSADNIIHFSLRRDKYFNVNLCLVLFFCAALYILIVPETLIPFIIIGCILTQYNSFFASARQDTLLVVKSVGIHIKSRREFGIFTSIEFLPWDTVEDIFINEVIKGQRVLYYLTFIVKESADRQNSRRLVPLFQDLLPERKCLEYMYGRLANLIGSTKRRRVS